jgi:diguanylate cyclase (GGDEF)-like protein
MSALIWGRHILNNRHIQLFLLNTREELRAAKATRLNEQLSSLAYTDPLTEIPSRRYFDEICASMSDTTKNLFPLSLCMIDIDHFKKLNDNLGHLQGDRCLRIIATAIRQHLRATDILARYGGEEFVLLLPGASAAAARETAERICGAIASLQHPNPGSPFGRVTASFGIATSAGPPLVIQSLIEAADAALYRAKSAGRNRVAA